MGRSVAKLVALTGALLVVSAGSVLGANPATISVTVTIQNLSVSASGPVDFGVVTVASENVSGSASTVTNDGNTTETFSLSLTDPATWTAVQAAPSAAEEYALSAQFNGAQPLAATFVYATHALSTSSTSSSPTQFAGDQTGVSVAASASRSLWFRFNAPTSTSVTTEQTITVTVTASAG